MHCSIELKCCQGQTLQLITESSKKFYNLGPRAQPSAYLDEVKGAPKVTSFSVDRRFPVGLELILRLLLTIPTLRFNWKTNILRHQQGDQKISKNSPDFFKK
jgi:hypothetical protein